METTPLNVINQENTVVTQYNVVGTVNISNQTSARNATEPVEFNFTKPTKSFVGRDNEMDIIKELFFVKNEKMIVICGCAGYGKTELARQFVHQSKEDKKTTHILWMEAESTEKLRQSFQTLATVLQLPKIEDDKTLVKIIYQYLESSSYLIVFDNAIDRRQILNFEPTEGSYHCLVTSHLQDWGDDVPSVKLLPLALEDAVNVLHAVLGERFKGEDVALYEELANNVSCVPLALQVTAAYTRQEMRALKDDFNLHEHVQHVKKFFENIIDHPTLDSNTYNNTVSKAIQLSFKKIKSINNNISNLACNILHVCSYLYSDKILHSDLLEISCLKKFLKDSKDLIRACSLLSDFSFISDVNKKITIHRLVQITIIFQQIDPENINNYYISCLELLFVHNDNSDRHRNSILQYAEKHLQTFSFFLSQYKSIIISDEPFLYNLVCTGCELYLEQIFDQLNSQAAAIIDEHYLLHDAAQHKQHGVLELLLACCADVHKRNLNHGRTAFDIAARQLDLQAMELLIEHKADINVADKNGDTVLHQIIIISGTSEFTGRSEEVREVLRWLANHGANTEAIAKRGETLLHTATGALSVELIPFLVNEFSQSVHAEDIHKQTPIYYVSIAQLELGTASMERRLRTVTCLLELGARLDHKNVYSKTPAEHARAEYCDDLARYLENPSAEYTDVQITEHSEKLKALVSTRQTSDLTEELDQFGDDAAEKINKYCLVHEAARCGACDMVKLLLDRGADVNYGGDGDLTPLHIAAMDFDVPMMRMLVSRGADVNAIAPGGRSVLFYLIWYLHVDDREEASEVLRWLVECGARTDVVSQDGKMLLHVAAFQQRTDIIACLIRDFHLDIDALDEVGCPPVFYVIFAVRNKIVDEERAIKTAACLFELGARFDVRVFDETPALYAYGKGFKKLGKYLENPNKHVDTETGRGRWWWNNTYVGVGVAAAAAATLHIYRNS